MHHRHPHRPRSHRSGRTSGCAGGRGLVPARVGRAGPARAVLLRRLRHARRRPSTRRRRAAAPGRRLPRLRPRRRRSSRRSRCPPRARPPGEPVRRRRHARPLRPRRAGSPRCCAATPRSCARCSTRRRPSCRAGAGTAGPTGGSPTAPSTSARCSRAKEHIRAGRRVPDRPLAARRAADVGERARALPRAAARQPVAVPVPARARRARADRLLAGDAGQGRGTAGEPQPDRRHDRARAGRRRAPARTPRRTARST